MSITQLRHQVRALNEGTRAHQDAQALFDQFVDLMEAGLANLGRPSEDPRLLKTLQDIIQRYRKAEESAPVPAWVTQIRSLGLVHGLFHIGARRAAFYYFPEDDLGLVAVVEAARVEFLRFSLVTCTAPAPRGLPS